MTNPFELFAHQNAPRKAPKKTIKKNSELDEKLQERNKLYSSYKRIKKRLKDTIVATDAGRKIEMLTTNLRQFSIKDAPQIREFITQAAWLKDLSIPLKRFALSQIDIELSKIWVKAGYDISAYNDDHMDEGMISESNPFGFKDKLIYKIRREIDGNGEVK